MRTDLLTKICLPIHVLPCHLHCIFQSHIHIGATFWWLAVAALPRKTTLNNLLNGVQSHWVQAPWSVGIYLYNSSHGGDTSMGQ